MPLIHSSAPPFGWEVRAGDADAMRIWCAAAVGELGAALLDPVLAAGRRARDHGHRLATSYRTCSRNRTPLEHLVGQPRMLPIAPRPLDSRHERFDDGRSIESAAVHVRGDAGHVDLRALTPVKAARLREAES